MSKRTWNAFVSDHNKAATIALVVSLVRIPTGPLLDKNRKTLPTPFSLVRDWLGGTLTGDWVVKKDGKLIVVLVASISDAELVLKMFPATAAATKTRIADKTIPVVLRIETFVSLAKEAGFAIAVPQAHATVPT
jgi:hypothetical protein